MEYHRYQVGDKVWFMANPKNFEELRHALHNEPTFLDYDPNEPIPEDLIPDELLDEFF